MASHSFHRKLSLFSPAPTASVRSTWRGRGRPAATAVEFAVAALVFFLFVLGLVEVGRGLMLQHLLLNAARQGCRTGILPSSSNSQIDSAVSDSLAPAGITAQSVSVTVNGASADASTANSGDDINVAISVPIAAVTWLPFSNYLSGKISAQYTLRKQ